MRITSMRTFKKIKNKKKIILREYFLGAKNIQKTKESGFQNQKISQTFLLEIFFQKTLRIWTSRIEPNIFQNMMKKNIEIFDMKKIDL